MIKLENISKTFAKTPVLSGINLHIKVGEKVLIMGQNGAGKSTLMKVILAQLICDSGRVFINGLDPFKQRKKALANLAFVPQTPPPLKLRVSELCEYATKLNGFELSSIKTALNALEFDYEKECAKLFTALSGGMKQKLLIAIALCQNAAAVLFDEPTANLDPRAREQFLHLLQRQDKTMIFISHRIDEVQSLASRVIEMDLGKITRDYFVDLNSNLSENSAKNSRKKSANSKENSRENLNLKSENSATKSVNLKSNLDKNSQKTAAKKGENLAKNSSQNSRQKAVNLKQNSRPNSSKNSQKKAAQNDK